MKQFAKICSPRNRACSRVYYVLYRETDNSSKNTSTLCVSIFLLNLTLVNFCTDTSFYQWYKSDATFHRMETVF
jgi:hypothetical protein